MNDEVFSDAQKIYLEGLASGLNLAKGRAGGGADGAAPAGPDRLMFEGQANNEAAGRKLVPEEKMKRERHPFDRWHELTARAEAGEFPKGTDILATKFFGMFYVAPAQDSYMCRLRLPNGILKAHQLAGVTDLARRYAGPYAHITTRANLQIREIGAEDPIHVLTGLYALGIINKGAGADNVRNITGSPLAGIDPDELVDTRPLAEAVHYHILNSRELYGLPRKFNISIDGGGRPAVLENTNDIGLSAVEVRDGRDDVPPGVYFRLGLGGITGHHDFTRGTGRLLPASAVVAVCDTILKIFIEHGNRSDRKKARLKYLLDDWGMDRFVSEIERRLPETLIDEAGLDIAPRREVDRYAHIGVHRQRQAGLSYVGVTAPVGRLTLEQMDAVAAIAARFGSGDVRLTVWQNLIVSDIRDEDIPEVVDQLESVGLSTQPNAVRSNLVACTGNTGCKFSASNTKRHALEIADYLDERLALDRPVNIHLTGCHHSCAQHFIGDIGLIACNVEVGDEDVEGYDVLVGGGYASEPRLAEVFQKGVPADDVPALLESILSVYLDRRADTEEDFTAFIARGGIDILRETVRERAA